MRAYAISMTVIMLVWAGVAIWGARELMRALQYAP